MPPDPAEKLSVVYVQIVFPAGLIRSSQRKPRRVMCHSACPVQIEYTDEKIISVAYQIRVGTDGMSFNVLLHRGRLFWPLRYINPPRWSATDPLEDLREGRLDLFCAKRHGIQLVDFERDPGIRRVVWSDQTSVAARVNAALEQNLLLVGTELYAAGGVPLVVKFVSEGTEASAICSSGADRHGDPASSPGLALTVGGFHMPGVQAALASGSFSIPRKTTKSPRRGPSVRVYIDHPVDWLELRIDAAFRLMWGDVKQLRCQGDDGPLADVYSRFIEALDGNSQTLTAARCEALQALRLSYERFFPVYCAEFGAVLDDTLRDAAAAGITVKPKRYRLVPRLTKADDDYLGSLAPHAFAPGDGRYT